MSRRVMFCSGGWAARSIIRRRAYLPLVEIFMDGFSFLLKQLFLFIKRGYQKGEISVILKKAGEISGGYGRSGLL
jgi:hypothetical protein